MVVVARALGDSNAMSATLEIPMINCELFFIIQSPLIPFNKILPPLAAGRLEWRGEETATTAKIKVKCNPPRTVDSRMARRVSKKGEGL